VFCLEEIIRFSKGDRRNRFKTKHKQLLLLVVKYQKAEHSIVVTVKAKVGK
jgi:hypothetical protein